MSELVTIADAVRRLNEGRLVAFPTETVYGLGAPALREDAVALVYAAKGRPSNNPLIVHVADQAMAASVSSRWPDRAQSLAAAFWPGPLTIIVPRASHVPAAVTAGSPGVAVRCPDHPVALDLLRALGAPLVGPSANKSGLVSPTTAAHVLRAFEHDDVGVLDGGPCRAGIESTVVSLMDRRAVVLRRGVIGADEIARALGEQVDHAPARAGAASPSGAMSGAPEALPSPGMLERHYAPRTQASLFDADEWPEIVDDAAGPVVVLSHERSRHVDEPHRLIRMPIDAPAYAAMLYAALHEADALGATRLLIERPASQGSLWDAIRDRLSRATA